MKKIFFACVFSFFATSAFAQVQTRIIGDSVYLQSNTGTAELILENSTKTVNGFLFNKANGRTEFRKGLIKLDDNLYLIGSDTLNLSHDSIASGDFIQNQYTAAQTGAGFWIDGQSRIDNELLIGTTDNGAYDLQLTGDSYLDGNIKAQALQLAESTMLSQDFSTVTYGPSQTVPARLTLTHNTTNGGGANILLNGRQGGGGTSTNPYIFFGDNQKAYAAIQGVLRGGGSNNTQRGDILFHTTPDISTTALTERMRVLSNGNVLVGTTVDDGYKLDVKGSVRFGEATGNYRRYMAFTTTGASDDALLISTPSNVAGAMTGFRFAPLTTNGGRLKGFVVSLPNVTAANAENIGFEIDDTVSASATITGIRSKVARVGATHTKTAYAGYFSAISDNGPAYGLYSAAGTNYFSDNTGMGVTTPEAKMHIAAGTATAHTAPLKLTAGTNLTTPENGAVEYDGSNYFVTSSTIRYTVAKTMTATALLNFGSTAAGSSTDLTITLTGAADGDAIALGVPNAAVTNNGNFTAWVSASDTVTVRFSNNSLTNALDPASGTFRVSVIKY